MKLKFLKQLVLAGLLGSSVAIQAITPAELQKQQAAGEKITVIDLRNNEQFKNSHIPGAINVPAGIVPEKTLPPLGRVVAYDDGLGHDAVSEAVAALNRKKGIQAEALEGGFVAWEMSQAATTVAPGMEREKLSYITFDELKGAQANDLVLVDLRKPAPSQNKAAAADVRPNSQSAFSDLTKVFPNKRITKTPFETTQTRQGAQADAPAKPPLLVLIDNGDGSAQATARTLRASGNSRVVILAGGEEIIARDGQPGLQRQGSGGEVTTTNVPPSQSK
jgi:rhodanese-related sulfurtransferase